MAEKFIETDKIKIRYVEEHGGSKLTVVLLHGMAFSADTWLELGTIEFLAGKGFHTVAIDMPGFGKSGGKRLNRHSAADVLKEILDILGISAPVIVGPSMGGGIALSYAIRYDDVKGLVLIAPAGLKDESIINNLDKIENVPVLIFWGDKDKIFPLKMSDILTSKLKKAKLVVCEGAPHPCYLKSKDVFHQELLAFLKSLI